MAQHEHGDGRRGRKSLQQHHHVPVNFRLVLDIRVERVHQHHGGRHAHLLRQEIRIHVRRGGRSDQAAGRSRAGIRRRIHETELDDLLLAGMLFGDLKILGLEAAHHVAVRVGGHHVHGDQAGVGLERAGRGGCLLCAVLPRGGSILLRNSDLERGGGFCCGPGGACASRGRSEHRDDREES